MTHEEDYDFDYAHDDDASAVIVLFLFAVYGFVIGAAVVGLIWWIP